MTEYEIEYRVEKMIDKLDAKLMSGAITQAQYDEDIEFITQWADQSKTKREWYAETE